MIGSTSWVIPGTYYENALLLEELVDFVELLVYTWDEDTKTLLFNEMDKLLQLDLSYTVHLPMDRLDNVICAYNFFEDAQFPAINYVLHPIEGWRTILGENIALENLKEIIEPHNRMVFDVGHHFLGEKFPAHLKEAIVEIHAMGVIDGRDHLPLDRETAAFIKGFMGDLITENVLINFEVFDLEDLKNSLKVWSDTFVE